MLDLPICQDRFLELSEAADNGDVTASLSKLSDVELAGLVFLLKSTQLNFTTSNDHFILQAEQILSKLLGIVATDRASCAELARSSLSGVAPQAIISALAKKNIHLTPDGDSDQDFVDGLGEWDFQKRHDDNGLVPAPLRFSGKRREFLPDQAKLLSVFMADPIENLHVQGVSGSGKTDFVSQAIELLPKDNVLVLAMTWQQIKAAKKRIKHEVKYLTFGNLADLVIQRSRDIHIPDFWARKDSRFSVSYSNVSAIMGYGDFSRLNRLRVAEAVNQTVTRFCYSMDRNIQIQHIPKLSYLMMDQPERAVIVDYAINLWGQITNPQGGIRLPIRTYHRIKLWSLMKKEIPAEFKYIFVDETHDLPNPIVEILDKSTRGVVTLGDSYQAIGKEDNMIQRPESHRKRTMNTSYRVGSNSSDLFNSILNSHPEKPLVEFEGRRNTQTKITKYENDGEIDCILSTGACAILGKHNWSLLKTILHLSSNNVKFAIHEGTVSDLTWLVEDAIKLYHKLSNPTHRAFYKFETWQRFYDAQPPDIQSILDKTICRGFHLEHFRTTLKKKVVYTPDAYLVARVEDCRNMEFGRVLLLEDVMSIDGELVVNLRNAINLIYLGASRAINEVIIPERLDDWLYHHRTNRK